MWSPTHVQITVCRARNMKTKGKNGTNDVYVVIKFDKDKFQTSVCERTKEPDWWEQCDFPLNGVKSVAKLKIFHRNLIGRDDFLGQIELDVEQFKVHERPKAKWYPLLNKPGSKSSEQYRGEIEVIVSFNVKSLSSSQLTLNNRTLKSTSVTRSATTTTAAAAADGRTGSLKAFTAVRGIGDKFVNKASLGGLNFRSENKKDVMNDSPTRTRTSVILPMSYSNSQPFKEDITDDVTLSKHNITSDAEEETDSESENGLQGFKKTTVEVLPSATQVKTRQLSHSGRFLSQSTVDISSFSSSRSMFGDIEKIITSSSSSRIEPVSEEPDSAAATDDASNKTIYSEPLQTTIEMSPTEQVSRSENIISTESQDDVELVETNVTEQTDVITLRVYDAPVTSITDDVISDDLHDDDDDEVRGRWLENLTEEDEVVSDGCLVGDNELRTKTINCEVVLTGFQQQTLANAGLDVGLKELDTVAMNHESNMGCDTYSSRFQDTEVASAAAIEENTSYDSLVVTSDCITANNNIEYDVMKSTVTSQKVMKYQAHDNDLLASNNDVINGTRSSGKESTPERRTLKCDVTKLFTDIPNDDDKQEPSINEQSNSTARAPQTLEMLPPTSNYDMPKRAPACVTYPLNTQLSANIVKEYSSYSKEELLQLVVKQRIQLREREAQVSDLEQYIDKLLAKVIEQQPLLLCAPCDPGAPVTSTSPTLSAAASRLASESPGLAATIRSNAMAKNTTGPTSSRRQSPFIRQSAPQTQNQAPSTVFTSSGRQKLFPQNPFLSLQKMLK